MKNSGMLSAIYIATAISLAAMAALNYLGGQYPLQPLAYGEIAILVVLDVTLLYVLSTQEEVSDEVIFCTLSFVGLSALIILYFVALTQVSTALLSMGYSLLFLLGIAAFVGKEETKVIVEKQPRIIERRPDATLARKADQIAGKQDEEAVQRKIMQHRLERKVDEVRHTEKQSKDELKDEIDKKVEEVKKEEKQTKQELKKDLAEVKKMVEKNEVGFYVASKTGTSLHKKDCIIVANIPKKNRITFDSEKVAVKQGYKLCRVCIPAKK